MRTGIVKHLLLINWIFWALPASAEVLFVPERSTVQHVTDRAHVLVSGEIVAGDFQSLRDHIAQQGDKLGSTPLIVLDSSGGDVLEALKIGRFLREISAWTVVDARATCSSSCVFVFVAGVQRSMFNNGQLGLHRPRFDHAYFAGLTRQEASEKYDQMVMDIKRYFEGMNVSQKIFDEMLKIPSQRIEFVDRRHAEERGLLGADPAWEEWSRAREIQRHGEEFVRARDDLVECYNSGADKEQCDHRYRQDIGRIQ